jgi:hypothetical protein
MFYSSMALKTDGSIAAWGDDSYSQVSGTPAGNGFVQVAGASSHALALTTNGSIVSWGDDSYNQVTDTPAGNDFAQVAGGGSHSLALKSDDSIVSWGRDDYNQVTDTPAGNDFVQVAGGLYHSLALKADGTIVSWGRDDYSQVTDTPPGDGFVMIAAKGSHSVALKSDGSIVSWGRDNYSQVTDTPTGSGFVQLTGGGFHSAAILPFLTSDTPVGAGVMVRPPPTDGFGVPIENAPAVSLEFESVTVSGDTTVVITEDGPAPPGSLVLVGIDGVPTYFDIETTATFEGLVEICINYSGFEPVVDPANLELAHIVADEWVDITTSNDTFNKVLCGETAAFSYFAVVEETDPVTPVNCDMIPGHWLILNTQAQIDNFQASWGGGDTCNTVPGKLVVEGPDITNLDGLSALVTVTENVYILSNPLLPDLNGLSSLSSAGSLTVDDNDSLTNLDGLSSLSNAGGIGITDNDSLANIDGLSGLVTTDYGVYINSNPLLTNVNGLSSIISMGSLALIQNGSLTNLDGLSTLTSVGGDFFIWDNSALINVTGLSTLTSVGGDLVIWDNSVLTNVTGLAALASVSENVYVERNISLADCHGLMKLLDQTDDAAPGPGPGVAGIPDVGEDVVLSGNGQGCNSLDEIFTIFRDSFED